MKSSTTTTIGMSGTVTSLSVVRYINATHTHNNAQTTTDNQEHHTIIDAASNTRP
jgi:hypothetical protein